MTRARILRIEGVEVDAGPQQYALVIRCTKGHSGNTRFAHHSRGWWECCGCMTFRSTSGLLDDQAKAKRTGVFRE